LPPRAETVAFQGSLMGRRRYDLAGACFHDLAILTADLSEDPQRLWWIAGLRHWIVRRPEEDHPRDVTPVLGADFRLHLRPANTVLEEHLHERRPVQTTTY